MRWEVAAPAHTVHPVIGPRHALILAVPARCNALGPRLRRQQWRQTGTVNAAILAKAARRADLRPGQRAQFDTRKETKAFELRPGAQEDRCGEDSTTPLMTPRSCRLAERTDSMRHLLPKASQRTPCHAQRGTVGAFLSFSLTPEPGHGPLPRLRPARYDLQDSFSTWKCRGASPRTRARRLAAKAQPTVSAILPRVWPLSLI